ncbi:MAG: guanylate kinase [Clostridia bacterium]|nr:guanylate kinase [Clostridia bacterium]
MTSETAKNSKRAAKKLKGSLLVLSGCAGSGKGTVLKELFGLSDRFRTTVSLTTRSPRPGEKEGVSYFFTDREDFEKRIAAGEMAEYAEYCGNLYGTLKSQIQRLTDAGFIAVLEIETTGALQIMEQFPDHISVFIVPPSYAELSKRLRGRGTETEEQIKGRMGKAKKEVALSDRYKYLLINFDSQAKACAEAILAIAENKDLSGLASVCRDREKFVRDFLSEPDDV